jgi:uncharacterized membrane protein YjgN (DUF898 family)
MRQPPTSVPTVAVVDAPLRGAAAAATAQPVVIRWQGDPWSLAGVSIINAVLMVLTLGIYQFWARTEIRRRIWSSIRVDHEPLAYTGTGGELFRGFLIISLIVVLPVFLLSIGLLLIFGLESPQYRFGSFAPAVLFLYLSGVAAYSARRYRLSRTNWRSIRGFLGGSPWGYGWTSFWTMMLAPLLLLVVFAAFAAPLYLGVPEALAPTIGRRVMVTLQRIGPAIVGIFYLIGIVLILLSIPWRTTILYRRMTAEMTFGSRPFAFDGWAGPLYARFIARWIGVLVLAITTPAAIAFTVGPKLLAIQQAALTRSPPPPLSTTEVLILVAILLVAALLYGLLSAWYRAAEQRYLAAHTFYEGHPFKLSITAGGLIWVSLTNLALVLVTLGVMRPVAQARTARYIVENLALDGPIDLAAIAQNQAALDRSGEGMGQVFDVDAF